MELFFIYLLKSTVLIALFYLCYQVFLSKETFFMANRIFLLIGVPVSFLLPVWYLTKTVYVQPMGAGPVLESIVTNANPETIPATFDWWSFTAILYGLGVLFFLGKLLFQLYSLWLVIKRGNGTKSNGFTLIESTVKDGPFSFFHYIVYNPALYDKDSLQSILTHEKVHALQMHSVDLLLMHLLCMVQWCNPFAWGYKKSVGQNLEYLADMATTRTLPCKKEYQYLLLQQSVDTAQEFTIINPFFNSLIKKRIVMINRKKSNQINVFKYAFVLPFLVLFLFTINTKVIAQTTGYNQQDKKVEIKTHSWSTSFVVKTNTTDEELKTYQEKAKEDGISLKFENIDRNSKGEIVQIVSSYKDSKGNTGNWNLNENNPIQPYRFYYKLDLKNDSSTMGYEPIKISQASMGNSDTGQGNRLTPAEKTHIKGAVKQQIAQQPIEVEGRGRGDHLYSFLKPSIYQQPKLTLTGYVQEAQEKKPAYIVDGQLQDKSFVFEKLDKSSIESIHVFKGQKAKDIFGKSFENGVVQIVTKNMQEKGWKVSVAPQLKMDPEKIADVTDFFTETVSNPIVVVDGQNKGKDYKNIRIKQVDIVSASLFAPSNKTSKKYGKQAKDGVLEIITKNGKE